MTIYFMSGGKYDFHDVSRETYDGLLHARHKQTYFNETVKDKFKHTKIY
jgi:hypothetical protein